MCSPTEPESPSIFSTPKWPSSRRAHSISSTSSYSSSSSGSDSLPATPCRYSGGGRGEVPFSWESIPGIPKNQFLRRIESSRNKYLPLPPAASSYDQKNYDNATGDPFFAALVECSKGGDEYGSGYKGVVPKVGTRNLFVSSCKNATDHIAESLVFVPRGRNSRIGYKKGSIGVEKLLN